VLYAETPANPTCRLTDLQGLGALALALPGAVAGLAAKPLVVVDGTFASPYHQRSLEYAGVDVAIQSATKYLGGHSDLIAGSVSTLCPEVTDVI
jgi:cystathionine beta-lyase/cystathionine gamma-synthase